MIRVALIGATGAVGGATLDALLTMDAVTQITTLGRRPVDGITDRRVTQFTVDVADPNTYAEHLAGCTTAICTLGVGEPTKVDRATFTRIDHDLPLAFAKAAKQAGVTHFQLLGSIGASATSRSFFLRTKGDLEEGIKAQGFDRTSLFRPSMILTPTNRYGFSQALTLAFWPKLTPLLAGPFRKFRGTKLARLGSAIAHNAAAPEAGVEVLTWDKIDRLANG